jgi:hypothetical protein
MKEDEFEDVPTFMSLAEVKRRSGWLRLENKNLVKSYPPKMVSVLFANSKSN